MQALPIDVHREAILAAVRERRGLVIVAEPGAGKTTRVPRMLLDAGFAREGEILVLEPRRLAARMSAARVADELGEEVGKTVGYAVRFDTRASAATKIRFVTEGIASRMLLERPTLPGVRVLVLDEVHERSLDTDLAIALGRIAREKNPQLAIVAMSATIDAAPLAAFLEAPILEASGRRFPVEIEHAERPDPRRLEERVAAAVQKLVVRGLDGDVLVFLPGAAEIRRAADAVASIAERNGIDVAMLHGELAASDQDRAIRRGPRPKIVLSTNVAETSLTLEGVVAVVDSGLARIARHSPFSGLPSLEVEPISQASATQRAGRAGRVRPGVCLRLYTRAEHDARKKHEAPEIRRVDLCAMVLGLRAAGRSLPNGGDPRSFPFFEPPDRAAIDGAEDLLLRLGALEGGEATAMGREILALRGLHPRVARMAIECARRGAPEIGALGAALLGEREIRTSHRGGVRDRRGGHDQVGESDLLARIEAFEAVAHGGPLNASRIRSHDLDVGAVMSAERARKDIERALPRAEHASKEDEETALRLAALAAFPDRVAKRRRPSGAEIVLSGGGSAELDERSVVKEASFLVALEAEDRGARRVVRVASAIEPEWLLELFEDRVVERDELHFDEDRERVVRRTGLAYDGLVLDESVDTSPSGDDVSRLLAQVLLRRGFGARDEGAIRLMRRVAFAAKHDARIATLSPSDVEAALAAMCEGRCSLAELRGETLDGALRARLGGSMPMIDRLAPEHVAIPGRPRVDVHYEEDRDPHVESRMQDFFGAKDGPRIVDGKVPLVLHLLAPNGRAQQVTTDLAGFWDKHYPALRKELMRRYPRHYWPDDPRTAEPRKPTRR